MTRELLWPSYHNRWGLPLGMENKPTHRVFLLKESNLDWEPQHRFLGVI